MDVSDSYAKHADIYVEIPVVKFVKIKTCINGTIYLRAYYSVIINFFFLFLGQNELHKFTVLCVRACRCLIPF
jgi:hypothetical protein